MDKKCLKIMVIENDIGIMEGCRAALEFEGYTPECFLNAKDAIDRLHRNPDTCLILLDLLMPDMNGWEFMKEFLKLPVTIIPIPVYIFTVVKEKDGETAAMGAQGFIKKPIDLEYLLKIVNDHCQKNT